MASFGAGKGWQQAGVYRLAVVLLMEPSTLACAVHAGCSAAQHSGCTFVVHQELDRLKGLTQHVPFQYGSVCLGQALTRHPGVLVVTKMLGRPIIFTAYD